MPSTIDENAPIVTLINVFTVDPARADELVGLLERATVDVMRHLPGFVSANLHRSLDGTHVANYAQWESAEAMAAMRESPEAQEHMGAAAALADFAPALYTVTSTHGPAE